MQNPYFEFGSIPQTINVRQHLHRQVLSCRFTVPFGWFGTRGPADPLAKAVDLKAQAPQRVLFVDADGNAVPDSDPVVLQWTPAKSSGGAPVPKGTWVSQALDVPEAIQDVETFVTCRLQALTLYPYSRSFVGPSLAQVVFGTCSVSLGPLLAADKFSNPASRLYHATSGDMNTGGASLYDTSATTHSLSATLAAVPAVRDAVLQSGQVELNASQLSRTCEAVYSGSTDQSANQLRSLALAENSFVYAMFVLDEFETGSNWTSVVVTPGTNGTSLALNEKYDVGGFSGGISTSVANTFHFATHLRDALRSWDKKEALVQLGVDPGTVHLDQNLLSPAYNADYFKYGFPAAFHLRSSGYEHAGVFALASVRTDTFVATDLSAINSLLSAFVQEKMDPHAVEYGWVNAQPQVAGDGSLTLQVGKRVLNRSDNPFLQTGLGVGAHVAVQIGKILDGEFEHGREYYMQKFEVSDILSVQFIAEEQTVYTSVVLQPVYLDWAVASLPGSDDSVSVGVDAVVYGWNLAHDLGLNGKTNPLVKFEAGMRLCRQTAFRTYEQNWGNLYQQSNPGYVQAMRSYGVPSADPVHAEDCYNYVDVRDGQEPSSVLDCLPPAVQTDPNLVQVTQTATILMGEESVTLPVHFSPLSVPLATLSASVPLWTSTAYDDEAVAGAKTVDVELEAGPNPLTAEDVLFCVGTAPSQDAGSLGLPADGSALSLCYTSDPHRGQAKFAYLATKLPGFSASAGAGTAATDVANRVSAGQIPYVFTQTGQLPAGGFLSPEKPEVLRPANFEEGYLPVSLQRTTVPSEKYVMPLYQQFGSQSDFKVVKAEFEAEARRRFPSTDLDVRSAFFLRSSPTCHLLSAVDNRLVESSSRNHIFWGLALSSSAENSLVSCPTVFQDSGAYLAFNGVFNANALTSGNVDDLDAGGFRAAASRGSPVPVLGFLQATYGVTYLEFQPTNPELPINYAKFRWSAVDTGVNRRANPNARLRKFYLLGTNAALGSASQEAALQWELVEDQELEVQWSEPDENRVQTGLVVGGQFNGEERVFQRYRLAVSETFGASFVHVSEIVLGFAPPEWFSAVRATPHSAVGVHSQERRLGSGDRTKFPHSLAFRQSWNSLGQQVALTAKTSVFLSAEDLGASGEEARYLYCFVRHQRNLEEYLTYFSAGQDLQDPYRLETVDGWNSFCGSTQVRTRSRPLGSLTGLRVQRKFAVEGVVAPGVERAEVTPLPLPVSTYRLLRGASSSFQSPLPTRKVFSLRYVSQRPKTVGRGAFQGLSATVNFENVRLTPGAGADVVMKVEHRFVLENGSATAWTTVGQTAPAWALAGTAASPPATALSATADAQLDLAAGGHIPFLCGNDILLTFSTLDARWRKWERSSLAGSGFALAGTWSAASLALSADTGLTPSSSAACSVGNGGRILVTGAPFRNSDQGSVLVTHVSPAGQELETQELGSDVPGARFGASVALNHLGTVLAVGAPGTGAVHLYRWEDNGLQDTGSGFQFQGTVSAALFAAPGSSVTLPGLGLNVHLDAFGETLLATCESGQQLLLATVDSSATSSQFQAATLLDCSSGGGSVTSAALAADGAVCFAGTSAGVVLAFTTGLETEAIEAESGNALVAGGWNPSAVHPVSVIAVSPTFAAAPAVQTSRLGDVVVVGSAGVASLEIWSRDAAGTAWVLDGATPSTESLPAGLASVPGCPGSAFALSAQGLTCARASFAGDVSILERVGCEAVGVRWVQTAIGQAARKQVSETHLTFQLQTALGDQDFDTGSLQDKRAAEEFAVSFFPPECTLTNLIFFEDAESGVQQAEETRTLRTDLDSLFEMEDRETQTGRFQLVLAPQLGTSPFVAIDRMTGNVIAGGRQLSAKNFETNQIGLVRGAALQLDLSPFPQIEQVHQFHVLGSPVLQYPASIWRTAALVVRDPSETAGWVEGASLVNSGVSVCRLFPTVATANSFAASGVWGPLGLALLEAEDPSGGVFWGSSEQQWPKIGVLALDQGTAAVTFESSAPLLAKNRKLRDHIFVQLARLAILFLDTGLENAAALAALTASDLPSEQDFDFRYGLQLELAEFRHLSRFDLQPWAAALLRKTGEVVVSVSSFDAESLGSAGKTLRAFAADKVVVTFGKGGSRFTEDGQFWKIDSPGSAAVALNGRGVTTDTDFGRFGFHLSTSTVQPSLAGLGLTANRVELFVTSELPMALHNLRPKRALGGSSVRKNLSLSETLRGSSLHFALRCDLTVADAALAGSAESLVELQSTLLDLYASKAGFSALEKSLLTLLDLEVVPVFQHDANQGGALVASFEPAGLLAVKGRFVLASGALAGSPEAEKHVLLSAAAKMQADRPADAAWTEQYHLGTASRVGTDSFFFVSSADGVQPPSFEANGSACSFCYLVPGNEDAVVRSTHLVVPQNLVSFLQSEVEMTEAAGFTFENASLVYPDMTLVFCDAASVGFGVLSKNVLRMLAFVQSFDIESLDVVFKLGNEFDFRQLLPAAGMEVQVHGWDAVSKVWTDLAGGRQQGRFPRDLNPTVLEQGLFAHGGVNRARLPFRQWRISLVTGWTPGADFPPLELLFRRQEVRVQRAALPGFNRSSFLQGALQLRGEAAAAAGGVTREVIWVNSVQDFGSGFASLFPEDPAACSLHFDLESSGGSEGSGNPVSKLGLFFALDLPDLNHCDHEIAMLDASGQPIEGSVHHLRVTNLRTSRQSLGRWNSHVTWAAESATQTLYSLDEIEAENRRTVKVETRNTAAAFAALAEARQLRVRCLPVDAGGQVFPSLAGPSSSDPEERWTAIGGLHSVITNRFSEGVQAQLAAAPELADAAAEADGTVVFAQEASSVSHLALANVSGYGNAETATGDPTPRQLRALLASFRPSLVPALEFNFHRGFQVSAPDADDPEKAFVAFSGQWNARGEEVDFAAAELQEPQDLTHLTGQFPDAGGFTPANSTLVSDPADPTGDPVRLSRPYIEIVLQRPETVKSVRFHFSNARLDAEGTVRNPGQRFGSVYVCSRTAAEQDQDASGNDTENVFSLLPSGATSVAPLSVAWTLTGVATSDGVTVLGWTGEMVGFAVEGGGVQQHQVLRFVVDSNVAGDPALGWAVSEIELLGDSGAQADKFSDLSPESLGDLWPRAQVVHLGQTKEIHSLRLQANEVRLRSEARAAAASDPSGSGAMLAGEYLDVEYLPAGDVSAEFQPLGRFGMHRDFSVTDSVRWTLFPFRALASADLAQLETEGGSELAQLAASALPLAASPTLVLESSVEAVALRFQPSPNLALGFPLASLADGALDSGREAYLARTVPTSVNVNSVAEAHQGRVLLPVRSAALAAAVSSAEKAVTFSESTGQYAGLVYCLWEEGPFCARALESVDLFLQVPATKFDSDDIDLRILGAFQNSEDAPWVDLSKRFFMTEVSVTDEVDIANTPAPAAFIADPAFRPLNSAVHVPVANDQTEPAFSSAVSQRLVHLRAEAYEFLDRASFYRAFCFLLLFNPQKISANEIQLRKRFVSGPTLVRTEARVQEQELAETDLSCMDPYSFGSPLAPGKFFGPGVLSRAEVLGGTPGFSAKFSVKFDSFGLQNSKRLETVTLRQQLPGSGDTGSATFGRPNYLRVSGYDPASQTEVLLALNSDISSTTGTSLGGWHELVTEESGKDVQFQLAVPPEVGAGIAFQEYRFEIRSQTDLWYFVLEGLQLQFSEKPAEAGTSLLDASGAVVTFAEGQNSAVSNFSLRKVQGPEVLDVGDESANFTLSDLTGTDLSTKDLRDATFKFAHFQNTRMPSGLTGCNFQGISCVSVVPPVQESLFSANQLPQGYYYSIVPKKSPGATEREVVIRGPDVDHASLVDHWLALGFTADQRRSLEHFAPGNGDGDVLASVEAEVRAVLEHAGTLAAAIGPQEAVYFKHYVIDEILTFCLQNAQGRTNEAHAVSFTCKLETLLLSDLSPLKKSKRVRVFAPEQTLDFTAVEQTKMSAVYFPVSEVSCVDVDFEDGYSARFGLQVTETGERSVSIVRSENPPEVNGWSVRSAQDDSLLGANEAVPAATALQLSRPQDGIRRATKFHVRFTSSMFVENDEGADTYDLYLDSLGDPQIYLEGTTGYFVGGETYNFDPADLGVSGEGDFYFVSVSGESFTSPLQDTSTFGAGDVYSYQFPDVSGDSVFQLVFADSSGQSTYSSYYDLFADASGADASGGGGNSTAGAAGDPYVTNLQGEVFKLPKVARTYRLLQTDHFLLDAYVDILPRKRIAHVRQVFRHSSWLQKGAATLDGFYFTRFRIVDLRGQKVTVLDELGNFVSGAPFALTEIPFKKIFRCPIQGYSDYTEKRFVLDNVLVSLRQFGNPQILNGIEISLLPRRRRDLLPPSGLLIRGHFKAWQVGKRNRFTTAIAQRVLGQGKNDGEFQRLWPSAASGRQKRAVTMDIAKERRLFVRPASKVLAFRKLSKEHKRF